MDDTRVREIIHRLRISFPSVSSELQSINSYTFLIAVLLSAQTTDRAVNKVTLDLFKVVKTPEEMLGLGKDKLLTYIKHLGLYNVKAKYILELSRILIDKYDSQVPLNRNDLEQLPGIGRKSANVILNHLCNMPYIAVDTHVKRVAKTLGLSDSDNPLKIEQDLYEVIPSEYHRVISNLMVMHGRYVCIAKCPKCNKCNLRDLCKKSHC